MPGSRQEDFKRNNAFLYMTHIATPSKRTPALGVMKITMLLDLYLVMLNYYTLSWSDLCPRVQKIFKEIMHFHYMNHMTTG